MVWNNGDGSDVMEGAIGSDTVEVNGSTTDGDNFLTVPNGARVRFDRVNLVPFTLDIGTTENLEVNGLGGDDVIAAAGGLQNLIGLAFDGGTGGDRLIGSTGDDILTGGTGGDVIQGSDGRDRLDGQAGRDTLKGGGGQDWLDGAGGRDAFAAGGGNDRIDSSGQVLERVNCGAGLDKVKGGVLDRTRANCEVVRP